MSDADRDIARWQDAMSRGDFAAAWQISDSLLLTRGAHDQGSFPRHCQSIWDGTPLSGKRVLVRCYHGLGDTIQFIRYASLLKEASAEVVVWAQPSLIPLLLTVKGIDALVPLHDGVPDVEYDVDVEVTELPYVFRTMLGTIPADVPYVHVEAASLRRRDGRLRVGLIWQAGEWDSHRSVPFLEVRRLAELPGIEWHVLQREPWQAGWDGKLGVITGGDNPLDDARIMRALDLVVSVDTMTAHLAGAIGQKTWTLLPTTCDWRWLRARDDSPWYPTMHLFRQEEQGAWDAVIDAVMAGLQDLQQS